MQLGGVRLPGAAAPRFALDPIDNSARSGNNGGGAPRNSALSAKMLRYARVIARHNATRRERRNAAIASTTALAPEQEPTPRAALPLAHELAAVALASDADDAYRRADIAEVFTS